MSVVLGKAAKAEAGEIGNILSHWIDEVDWMVRVHAPSKYLGYGEMLIASADVTVARDAGKVAGFLARQGEDIQALYLRPGYREQGIGAGLLEMAKKEMTPLGLWTFQSNSGARRFYARHGFVEDQLTDGQGNDEKLPDVHMGWERK